MARANPNAFYSQPGTKLFIRRQPGNPQTWEVCQGRVEGKNKERTLIVEQVLSTSPKGCLARQLATVLAEKLGLLTETKEETHQVQAA